MKQSQQNKVDIAINTTKIEGIKEDITEIKEQVSNHLPSQIKSIENKITTGVASIIIAIIIFIVQGFIK